MKSTTVTLALFSILSLCSFTKPGPGDKNEPAPEATESKVQYRIQLGAYTSQAPESDLQLFEQIGGVSEMESKGKTVYLTPAYSSEEEASHDLPELRQLGFDEARKVVIIEDHVISAKNYHFFYDNKNCSPSEKTKLFKTQIRVINE